MTTNSTGGNSRMTDEALEPFDLASLRLDQNYSDGVAVRKLITMIRVGKPQKQHFVRVNPDPGYRISPVAVIDLKDDRESYLVSPTLAAELAGEFISVALFTGITRAGTLFLWPVPLPAPDGKHNPWHRSALIAVERAEHRGPSIDGCASSPTWRPAGTTYLRRRPISAIPSGRTCRSKRWFGSRFRAGSSICPTIP